MVIAPAVPAHERPANLHTGGIGENVTHPDGVPKVKGEFEYSSDLWADDMLWGGTLRSPHPYAKIWFIDASEAETMPGVHAILTHEDVPGRKTYGLEIPDQPVLAWDRVRYQGEPIAIVAADHPETVQRALSKIKVEYEVLKPLTDAEEAMSEESSKLHPSGNVLRHAKIRRGDSEATADVVVEGEYEVGMQDQAFLGPESGLAVPDGQGGVDLYISTQWLHVDRDQLADVLDLSLDKVRLTLSGVGGAFGGKEDLSMQAHACLLALHTGRPVKLSYNREESFFGHVHRHPFRLRYEHGATRDGELVYVKARIVADGGAYASTSRAVIGNATCFACGPYKVPNAQLDGYVVYTNNPPCGAMRGFGAVQACFGYESQMDKLAEALGMDPVDLRLKNAMKTGDELPTGQKVEGPAPVAELLKRLRDLPLPGDARTEPPDLREVPGGVSNATHGEGVKRGIGYAVGLKNVAKSAGYDDYSTARVRLSVTSEGPLVEVHTAAAECGQGLVTIQAQIARTELGVEQVAVLHADTAVGSAGTSSASRQTYMTGGAVKAACEAVRERILRKASDEMGEAFGELAFTGGNIVSGDRVVASLPEILNGDSVEETREFRHRETESLDPETGQGNAHVTYIFAAHRAVVDVDTELGLVRVVEIATAQDVGKAINPQAVEGQIEGGTAQGLGLALLEEIQVEDGKIRNASFTDYLIPTILDMPPVKTIILELGDPEAPYGLKGVGEPPTVSSPPAIVAARRAATERELPRIPVKLEQIVGIAKKPPSRPPQPGSRGPVSPTKTIGG